MQVKLSYSVEEDDVLEEAAKLLGLKAAGLQAVIDLFTQIQTELGGPDDEPPNITKAQEMITECRSNLVRLDLRFSEVAEIVRAYDAQRQDGAPKSKEVPSKKRASLGAK
jgi:hypothetical protein